MEASSAARDNGECASDVPGSEAMAGQSTIHNGTWEGHIVPKRSFQQAEERLVKFDLELHPTKTRIINLDREQRCGKNRKDHQSHTFDFLGFTHYWGRSRKGNPTLCRKTSAKKFRRACKEMNIWLRKVRCTANLKDWWPTLRAKLRGHFQYYGISGNRRAIVRFHYVTKRLVFKWLNRRSQKASFTWKGFKAYLKHYPLPEPRIVHQLYTLSFDS